MAVSDFCVSFTREVRIHRLVIGVPSSAVAVKKTLTQAKESKGKRSAAPQAVQTASAVLVSGDRRQRLRDLDLNLLKVLEAVYSCGSLTNAAKRLGVTQPAVSAALTRLRDNLGDELFIRAGRGVSPTPVTRDLVHPVRQALQALENSLCQTRRFDPVSSQRKFVLSMSDRMEEELLPNIMGKLCREAPLVRIRNSAMGPTDAATALISGEIDIAFNPSGIPDTNELVQKFFLRNNLVCMVRPGHPILSKGDLFDISDYASIQHVLVANKQQTIGLVDSALGRLNVRRHVALRCQHRSVVPLVLRESDLAYTGERSYAIRHGLKTLALPFEVPETMLNMFWHRSQDQDPGHQWFRCILEAAAEARNMALSGNGKA